MKRNSCICEVDNAKSLSELQSIPSTRGVDRYTVLYELQSMRVSLHDITKDLYHSFTM